MKQILYAMIDLVAPSRCIVCGKPVPWSRRFLCEPCFCTITPPASSCERCSGVLDDEGACRLCTDRAFYLAKNIAVAEYTDAMRSVLFHFKFRRKKALSAHLMRLVERRFQGVVLPVQVITAVPLNRKKLWARGYNQSEVIAKSISKKLQIPYAALLKERKRGSNQKALGYRERFFNAIGRYEAADAGKALNRNVLLIDDVFTTGSTINECARVLLESGAAGVYSVTLARTPAGVSPLF